MVSQRRRQRANIKKTFFEKLMNIQYLNLPPYPNRWMVWLIQQGAVSRLAARRMAYARIGVKIMVTITNQRWFKVGQSFTTLPQR